MGLVSSRAWIASALMIGVSACASLLGVDDVGYSIDAGEDSSTDASSTTETGPGIDATPDVGACSNTASDPRNCGRCGHSCFGGSCVDGGCGPVIVANGQRGCSQGSCIASVVADDRGVYWATYDVTNFDAGVDVGAGHVAAAVCGESCDTTILAPDVVRAGALAVDTANVYFGSGALTSVGAVQACGKSGCLQQPKTLCPHQGLVDMKVSGNALLWTDGYTPGMIVSENAAGGVPANLADAGAAAIRLAADATYVFVSTGDNVLRCSRAGGGLCPIVAPQNTAIWYVALDDTYVYWTEGFYGGRVLKCGRNGDCSKGTSPPGVIADKQNAPGPIIVDDAGIYWINAGDPSLDAGSSGAILTCPVAGCPAGGPLVLAAQQNGPTSLAANRDSLFWANFGDGTIMRLAKP